MPYISVIDWALATGGVLNSTVGGMLYNGTTSAEFVMDADVGASVMECKKVSNQLLAI